MLNYSNHSKPKVRNQQTPKERKTQMNMCHFDGCPYKTSNKSDLNKHITRKHMSKKAVVFTCPEADCSYEYKRPEQLKIHLERDHSDHFGYLCHCGAGSKTLVEFRRHLRKNHPTLKQGTQKRSINFHDIFLR